MLLEEISTKLQHNVQDEPEEDLIQEVMNKYPPVNDMPMPMPMPSPTHIDSSSFLDSLPSVPKHTPSNNGTQIEPAQRNNSNSSNNSNVSSPSASCMKMPEPQPNISASIPPQQPPLTTNLLQLPTPSSEFSIPPTPIVDPRQLASWIVKKNDGNQPSVLILDVRPRQIFDQGFIKHKWIAQIEPLVLKQE